MDRCGTPTPRHPVAAVPERSSEADSPEGVAIAEVENQEMMAVLRLLPRARREVLMLRVVEGLSVEETAAALGKSPEAVRVLQQRALKSLAKQLRPEV